MLTTQLFELIENSRPLDNPKVVRLAIEGILDYIASSLLARSQDSAQALMRWIQDEGGHPAALLIGHSPLVTARQAALFNGYQAHLLDYDDVHEQVRGHPSAVILSALLSQIPLTQPDLPELTGKRFLAAYIIGIEVMARLGEAIGDGHYRKGWHNTATLGGGCGDRGDRLFSPSTFPGPGDGDCRNPVGRLAFTFWF
ncbi:MmgE/PrpD family protein [Utexia brackfieldae]|uniref:MmgE/PrpD family protein n=1 Tax=Utexia brackfieldae TaxID=3074108 RepID=UPI00370DB4B5